MHAFILAGGFATRLWPLTESRAKPLLPIGNSTILEHIICNIPEDIPITVSTNAVFEQDFLHIKCTLERTLKRTFELTIEDALSDTGKRGALGALSLWITKEQIQDDVLLLAGDNYTEASLSTFLSLYQGNPLIAGHDVGSLEAAKAFGTILLAPSDHHPSLSRVISFEEKPSSPRSSIVSTGWWILPQQYFPLLHAYAKEKPDNVGGIFEEFLRTSIPIDCFSFSNRWRDIGSFQSYLSLLKDVLGSCILCDATSTIDADTHCEGTVVIGPNTSVTQSSLKNCILFGDTTIHDSSLIDCILDESCSLRGVDLLYSMIRKGTTLQK